MKQVEAALTLEGCNDATLQATELIAAYDEAQGLPYLATRLAVQLDSGGHRAALRKPYEAGLDLFAASLASDLDADWNQVVKLLEEGGIRMMLLLRAAGFSLEEAAALMAELGGPEAERHLRLFVEIDREAARRVLFGRSADAEAADA